MYRRLRVVSTRNVEKLPQTLTCSLGKKVLCNTIIELLKSDGAPKERVTFGELALCCLHYKDCVANDLPRCRVGNCVTSTFCPFLGGCVLLAHLFGRRRLDSVGRRRRPVRLGGPPQCWHTGSGIVQPGGLRVDLCDDVVGVHRLPPSPLGTRPTSIAFASARSTNSFRRGKCRTLTAKPPLPGNNSPPSGPKYHLLMYTRCGPCSSRGSRAPSRGGSQETRR